MSPTDRFPTQLPRHGERYVPPPARPKKRGRHGMRVRRTEKRFGRLDKEFEEKEKIAN